MNLLWLFKEKKLIDWKQFFVALSSGLLMGLSPAPLNLWLLSWIALAPLWILIFKGKKSYREAALIGFVWGFGYHSLALFWITGVHPMTWMGVPWLASLTIAISVWLIVAFWGACLVGLWAFFFKAIEQKFIDNKHNNILNLIIIRVLIGITIWCCLETLWSYGSLWWSSLSYTQSPGNLAILQLTKFSGYNTVTAAIVAVNGLIAEAILSNKKYIYNLYKSKIVILPILLFSVLHLCGLWLYNLPIENDNMTAIKVGIIQGNVSNEIKLYPEGWRKAIKGYTTGYQKLAQQKVDVVLTPETALPFYWNIITDNSDFYKTVIKENVPVWVGAYGEEKNGYTNSLFTLTKEGNTFSRYDKTILVPLGEYIPFEPLIGGIIDRLSPLDAHLQAGKPQQIFDTPFGRAIVGICYESAFSRHFRWQTKAGGQFIITASNNAHYSASMPAQHHAQDVIRAIESDRWMARATNTGYSAFVDPHGNTVWQSQINRYQTHADTIYLRETETLYVQWGDWLTISLLIASVCSLAIDYK